jgi:hypothetical protein
VRQGRIEFAISAATERHGYSFGRDRGLNDNMVEYLRLIDRDFFTRFTHEWDRHDTVVLVGGLAVLVILALLVTRRK